MEKSGVRAAAVDIDTTTGPIMATSPLGATDEEARREREEEDMPSSSPPSLSSRDDDDDEEEALPLQQTSSTPPSTSTTTTTHDHNNPHHHPQPLSLEYLIDDYSLPSRGIRFRARGKEMKIYEHRSGQLILEERRGGGIGGGGGGGGSRGGRRTSSSNHEGEERAQDEYDDGRANNNKEDDSKERPLSVDSDNVRGILMKTADNGEYAFSFLRAAYCLMATFVGGFLFILGLCLLLFLFINLAASMGLSTVSAFRPFDFFAVLLSIPVFIYSMAMGMTLVGRFVVDAFHGHPFFGSFGLGVATTDWIAFVLYLGVPIVAFIVTLFLQMDNWWEISLVAWFASILTFWCLFSACVLWLEAWACLTMMEDHIYGTAPAAAAVPGEGPWRADRGGVRYWLRRAGEVTVRTMRYRWSGRRIEFKKVDALNMVTTMANGRCDGCISGCKGGLYSSFARWPRNPCFVQKPSKRIHTLDETLGNITFVTRYSWSLEKLFCRRGGLYSSIPITQGESSITEVQVNSNIACNILGNVITVLLFVGAMVWLGLPPAALGMVTILAMIFFAWVGFNTYRLFGLRDDIVNDENAVLYCYWEMYQNSSPTDGFLWAVLAFQVIFLYLVPLIFLCIANPPPAPLFAFLGLFSGIRHYLNIRVLILENGDYFDNNTLGVDSRMGRKEWKRKAMIYDLVRVGGDKARHFWTVTYLLFTVFFAAVAVWAYQELHNSPHTSVSESMEPVTLLDGYTYKTQLDLPYPTCSLKRGFSGIESVQLVDFAFLSKLAYQTDKDQISTVLDTWFGQGVAYNNKTLITEFRDSPSYTDYGFGSAVSYKAITFPSINGAVLTIRGTQTAWDVIADAQLWLAAILFQGLRIVLPFSEIFTPILHRMVWIIAHLESDSIKKVAFYRETKGFVDFLKDRGYNVAVTGHSLGGGLAIITGAEAEASAVAISGPNAMLSRETFLPPVTVEQLNTLTFNVIPARDPVPMIDDKARLYQNINCTAPANDILGCHAITRSICELHYTCGSSNRPVACECTLDFGYPEPIFTGMTTEPQTSFIETCRNMCKDAGGSSEKCARWKKKYEEGDEQ